MADYVYCPRVSATGSIAYNKGAMLQIVKVRDRIGDNVELESRELGYLGVVHKEDIFILPASGKLGDALKVKLMRRIAEHKQQKQNSLNGSDMRATATRGENEVYHDDAEENPRPEGERPDTIPYKRQENFRYSANDEAEALAMKKMKSYGPSKVGKFQVKTAARKAPIIGDDVAEAHQMVELAEVLPFMKK